MICSMTGFGRGQKEGEGYSVTIEIRTLNGRTLDTVIRMPKNYGEFEEMLRKQAARTFRRGRVEVHVQVDSTNPEQKAPHINFPLARFYWTQLRDLARELPGAERPRIGDLLRIPYIFTPPEAHVERELLQDLLSQALADALEQVNRMRCQEGDALQQDLLNRATSIRNDLALVDTRKDVIVLEYGNRLRERIQELLGETPVDENRLLQEIACSAERTDINEEIVRLGSHLDQLQELLAANDAVDGRRLDFLTQEMHREVNTMGSKTGDMDTTQAVLRMKSEIGKLKEQVQNIE